MIRITLGAAILALAAEAAETRTWTSRKGSNMEAQLVSAEGDEAVLLTGDGREVRLKFADLSLADRQYLVEYGGADRSAVTGEIGVPEKDVRIDAKTFTRPEKKLTIGEGETLSFEILETPHFVVATAGKVRPDGVAETAERLWHGMAFEHMNFRRDWADKRRLILLIEDREVHTALGKWYREFLVAEGVPQMDAQRATGAWDKIGATSIALDEGLIGEWNLHPRAILFNVEDDKRFRKSLQPFVVHMIAQNLLAQQMGGISNYGGEGYFAILTGFGFYKEIQLGGKSETQLIEVQDTAVDEITSTKGFEDGSAWAKTLRGLVKREKVKPDFAEMLGWSQAELDPEKLVLIYSFAAYANSTPERLSGFANFVRRVESSNQIPEPVEFAKLFGFDSVEDFQNDWIEYIQSTQFK